ncbi:MAG: NRDE family protein [Syntrophomonadaceae bacterium]|nr:NRDE family protein [Syntrophomonadaceae bacterium]
MCLILWALDRHPRYKLVIIANRDEFYDRPTAPVAFWEDCPSLLAGRDEKEGGTWMGITTDGRWAALTNYRDPSDFNSKAPSRGRLVLAFLQGEIDAHDYMQGLMRAGEPYNGYNLLAGTFDRIFYCSNRDHGPVQEVGRGVHGLSNGLLNTPWPKVINGKRALESALGEEHIDIEHLFAILADQEIPPDHEIISTGIAWELERELASLHVVSREYNYGTRSSSVVLIDRHDQVRFWERTFTPFQPELYSQAYFEFKAENIIL